MKKFRCQLCGGKIRNGRCELCGWINQTDKGYLLNKSSCDDSSLTHVHKENTFGAWSLSSDKKKGTKKTAYSQTGGKNTCKKQSSSQKIYKKNASAYSYRNTGSSQKKKKNKSSRFLGIIVILIIAVNILPHVLRVAVDEGMDRLGSSLTALVGQKERYVKDDNYEYVTRELSEDGEEWRNELDAGQYVVGVDIPEGQYQLETIGGEGGIHVSDQENSIYFYEQFSLEPRDDEICSLQDVRLYEGARVEIRDGLTLSFVSLNARTETMHSQENPLTESILLEAGGPYVAGESFDAGVYDVSITSGWGSFVYEVPVESEDYYDYYSVFMDSDYSQDGKYVYHNVTLPKGTQVTVDGANVTLTPSSRIVSENYKEMY